MESAFDTYILVMDGGEMVLIYTIIIPCATNYRQNPKNGAK